MTWFYVGAVTVAVAVTWVVCRMLERPPGRHVMQERAGQAPCICACHVAAPAEVTG
jgi:hypothetical protein